jgi:hypothetical protein
MLQVEMTDDIRKYQPKLVGPFTTRQCVCIMIGLLFALPAAFLIHTEDITNRIVIFCCIAAPFIACGYVKMDGAYLEVLLIRALYSFFLAPPKRKQVVNNTFKEYMDFLEKKKEQQKMSKMTKRELKKYTAQKASKKVVKYYDNDPKNKAFKIYK